MAMTLRLDENEQAVLRGMAEKEGLSQHEVARRAILERADRLHLTRDVQEAGERAVQRYSALLERLSK